MHTFEERLGFLAHGDVRPLLLATDVVHVDGMRVDVVLIDPETVHPGGYASRTLMTRSFPRATPADAEQLRARTVDDFVARLQVLLADVQPG